MRVALFASTFALLAGSPAFAQCVYVACNSGGQSATTYQQQTYHAPTAPQRAVPSYDEGFAAGYAARQTGHSHTHAAPVRVRKATATGSTHVTRSRSTASRAGSLHGHTARKTVSAHRSTPSTRATHHVRRARARSAHANHATNRHASSRQRTYVTSTHSSYHDPIKDRAATYRPAVYGQSTTMASMMSRSSSSYSSSSSSSSSITWAGPSATVNQGGQICGWGSRISTTGQGYAHRQAVWVCQCPQGWRPPGY